MKFKIELQCLDHKLPLTNTGDTNSYCCSEGCNFPVTEEIPRFVESNNYASSFGLQWKTFRKTQLDSFTEVPLSKDRLARIAGGDLDCFRGKLTLEAGCGAGRFTEVLLEAGAKVFAADISSAVEANYDNCSSKEGYFVCQADITKLPVVGEQFDRVVCVGVIQHTPSPELTMTALASYLKPGGSLFIDHYPPKYPVGFSRWLIRQYLLRKSSAEALEFCERLTDFLWPMHKLMWRIFRQSFVRKIPLIPKIRSVFLRISPIVDYHDAYLELGPDLLKTWALLDTHDTLTDVYKHLRSMDEIRDFLLKLGMVDIVVQEGGNGVEARCRKPVMEA